jgi:glycosyltransferase involved in cell wall biosynthesis
MKLYYFIDSIPEQRYSSSIHTIELIEQIVSRYGKKQKKYDTTIDDNENFDIQIYSLDTNPEMIEAEFHLEKRTTLKTSSPLFIKRFIHSAIKMPLAKSIEHGSIIHYFNHPRYKTIKKTKMILELDNIKEIVAPEFFKKKLGLFENIKAIDSSDLIITHSEYMAEELSNKLFIDPDKISIIPRAISQNTKTSDKDYDLTPYALPQNFILFVGKVEKYKNLERLIDCFRSPDTKNISLVIAGDCYGQYADYLKKISSDLKNDKLKFIGYINNKILPSIIKRASALVEPSYVNDFPETILQAQALGIPVIASDIPAHKTLLKNSVIYFSALSKEEMSEAINTVSNNNTNRNNLIRTAKTFSSKYTWDEIAPMYKKLYESLSVSH